MMRRDIRVSPIRLAGAAVTAAAVLLAGCGSGGTSGTAGQRTPGAPAGLVKALGEVKDSAPAREYFEWSDLRTVRRLAGLPGTAAAVTRAHPNQRWERVFGLGTNGLATFEPVITSKSGIDFFSADTATAIGQPPNEAMRIDGPGIDTAAITRSLLSLGAKHESADGRSFLAIGAEHSVDITGPLGAIGVVNQLDRSVATGPTFATGSAQAPVADVLGGGRSLAAAPGYRAAAGCLDDAVTATIAPPARVNAATPALLLAVGDRRPTSPTAPVTDVLCAVDASPGVVAQQETRLRAMLGPKGRIPQLPPSATLVGSLRFNQSVSGSNHILQCLVTLKPQVAPGLLYNILTHGDLGALVGRELAPRS